MQDWMKNFQNKTILELTIPGSHDSFAYSFHVDEKAVQPEYTALPKILNCAILRWCTTQHITIRQQLDAGVRYFDFRIYQEGEKYFTLHALKSIELNILLVQIRNFIELYPTEKVIIDINHLYNVTSIRDLKDYVNSYLGIENILECNSINFSKPLLALTGSYFVNYNNTSKIYSFWPNRDNFNDCVARYNSVGLRCLESHSNILNVMQCILTVKESKIVLGTVFPCLFDNSLEEMNDVAKPKFKDYVQNLLQTRRLNIVLLDFIEENDSFVNMLIDSNK